MTVWRSLAADALNAVVKDAGDEVVSIVPVTQSVAQLRTVATK